jgi:Transposase IS66 family
MAEKLPAVPTCSVIGSTGLFEGELPAHVRARASLGPEVSAQAANLTAGHHIPVYRATLLLCELAGVAVSAGWMAGIRGKAAALVAARVAKLAGNFRLLRPLKQCAAS